MRKSHLLSASALALGLAFGSTAIAQQPMPTTPGAAQQAPRAGAGEVRDILGKINIEERQEFNGRLVRAHSPEGHHVLLIVGPENMEGGKDLADFNQDKVRGQLTQAGFQSIEFVDDLAAVRGKLDDKAILALTAERGWRGATGPAKSGTPNLERLTEQLEKAGLSEAKEFEGKLVHARTAAGQTLFVLVGPEGFRGDSVELSAGELSKFQQRGFQNARIAENVEMVRGKWSDMSVIALTGAGLVADEPAATGTVGGTSKGGTGAITPMPGTGATTPTPGIGADTPTPGTDPR
jgi:hypothetical protein